MTKEPEIKLGAYGIFKALKDYYSKCSADEEIGMKAMLKYHWYLIRKNPQINIEIENEDLRRENAKLIHHSEQQQIANRILQEKYNDEIDYVKKLELKVDDLTEDLKVLNRLKT